MDTVREASSLILISEFEQNRTNKVSILTVKRSCTSTHYPSACVFSGGIVDPADKDTNWLDILPKSEINLSLKIIDPFGKECYYPVKTNQIPKALSLRICAIRETFEECGLLLCRKYSSSNCNNVTDLEINNKCTWRKRISTNAKEFFKLCLINECYPDIKKLYLWSNWCTPPYLIRRYDTKFFLAIVDNKVFAKPDYEEIEDVQWKGANDYLLENKKEFIFLPPPQFYELNRFKQFQDVESLVKFANKNLHDNYSQQYMPFQINAKNGIIILLPGDEKYLEFVKMSPNIAEINENIEEYCSLVMHRIIVQFGECYQHDIIIRNYNSQFNHILPESTVAIKKSKL